MPAFPRLRLQLAVPTEVTAASILPGDDRRENGWLASLGLAFATEALMLVVVVALFVLAQELRPAVDPKAPTIIQLAEMPPEPKPAPPEPPRPVERKVTLPQQVVPVPQPVPLLPMMPTEPSPFAQKAVSTPPTPPSPPTVATLSPDVLADYMAKIRASVQAALVYPAAGRELQFEGRTRVEFRLEHGVQSGARVVVSSGFRLFDQAALAAVRNAQYPQPPKELGGESRWFQVWVEFRL